MNPIPKKLLNELLQDKFYKKCIMCDSKNVSFHHCWIYARKQINEKYAILPVCEKHHDIYTKRYDKLLKWTSINLMNLAYMKRRYPKFDWNQEKKKLNAEFGLKV